jgi:hypothetical protein
MGSDPDYLPNWTAQNDNDAQPGRLNLSDCHQTRCILADLRDIHLIAPGRTLLREVGSHSFDFPF